MKYWKAAVGTALSPGFHKRKPDGPLRDTYTQPAEQRQAGWADTAAESDSTCRLMHHLCLSLHISVKVLQTDDGVSVFMWSCVPVIFCTCGFCPSNLFSTDSAHGRWHKCKVTCHFHIFIALSGTAWVCAQSHRMWLHGLSLSVGLQCCKLKASDIQVETVAACEWFNRKLNVGLYPLFQADLTLLLGYYC